MTLSTLHDLMEAMAGAEFVGNTRSTRRSFNGISTDTRSLKKGDVFLALRGENFDGHDYLKEAIKKRAKAAIVAWDWHWGNEGKKFPIPLIVVRDTLEAYGQIAAAHRRNFRIPVIAVAGSVGKTSTKEMLADLLSIKYTVLATEKNLNNRIGAPATILKLEKKHQVAVIEIGTNQPGEIAALCRAVEPTHGLITNIGEEHLELLKTVDGVAQEEGALFRWLAENGGTGFVNIDDDYLKKMKGLLPKHVTFGRTKRADYQVKVGPLDQRGGPAVEIIDHTGKKERSIKVQLATPGLHTASNALAATAVAMEIGLPPTKVKAGLANFQPVQDPKAGYARLAMVDRADGMRILNDTYNANPDSMRVALDTLARIKVSRKGKRIAVLGDMAELGRHAVDAHVEVGRLIPTLKKIDVVMFIGRHMRRAYDEIAHADRPAGRLSFFFRSREKMIRLLQELAGPEDVLLVKGSRSMAMEEIVQELLRQDDREGK